MSFLEGFLYSFVGSFVAVPLLLFLARLFALYVVVREQQCVVFELFGKVRQVINEPGLHTPWLSMGPLAMLVPFSGRSSWSTCVVIKPTCAVKP